MYKFWVFVSITTVLEIFIKVVFDKHSYPNVYGRLWRREILTKLLAINAILGIRHAFRRYLYFRAYEKQALRSF